MPKFAFNCENPIPPYAIGHETTTGPEGVTIIRDANTLIEIGADLLCNSCLTHTTVSAVEPRGAKLIQGINRISYNAALKSPQHAEAERNLLRNPINERLHIN